MFVEAVDEVNRAKYEAMYNRHYTDLMIFVGAGLVPARNGGKHKALPLQNANNFLIGINSNDATTQIKVYPVFVQTGE